MPAVREVSVKIEEGAGDAQKCEYVVDLGLLTRANLATSSIGREAGKLNLAVGAEVFYRNKAKAAEGEGILCNVTNVIGEGKQRRYVSADNLLNESYTAQRLNTDTKSKTPTLSPTRAGTSHHLIGPQSQHSSPSLLTTPGCPTSRRTNKSWRCTRRRRRSTGQR